MCVVAGSLADLHILVLYLFQCWLGQASRLGSRWNTQSEVFGILRQVLFIVSLVATILPVSASEYHDVVALRLSAVFYACLGLVFIRSQHEITTQSFQTHLLEKSHSLCCMIRFIDVVPDISNIVTMIICTLYYLFFIIRELIKREH